MIAKTPECNGERGEQLQPVCTLTGASLGFMAACADISRNSIAFFCRERTPIVKYIVDFDKVDAIALPL